MKNKWLIILLIASLIKGLVWLFFTPIFQIPDEPSHFSYVQFLAENNRPPHPRREVVTSKELFSISQIVNFNWKIEHPVWQSYQNNWQVKINAIPLQEKQEYISNEYLTSLKRPGLYYSAASLVYRIFYQQPFLWRFFSVRFFSLICQLVTIWLVYLISIKLTKKSWLSLAAAAGVSFHPGFSFIAGGVSYEALGILISTVFIYLAMIKAKIRWLLLTGITGILVKPDLIFLWLLMPFVLPKKLKQLSLIVLIVIFFGLILTLPLVNQIIRGKYPWLDQSLYFLPIKDYSVYANNLWQVLINGQFLTKTKDYLSIFFTVHWHQIFAWYWGVFGWLEKTLPPLTYTLLKILSIVSLVGLLKTWRRVWWLILIVLVQAAVVVANDWLSFMVSGQIYGIQGRYFLAVIGPQMILFVLGLSRFIPPKFLIAGAVLFNLIGLFTLFQYFGNVWF